MTADGYFRVPRGPHGIRHTAITEATHASRAAGLGLEAVMAFSDHASVATSSHYLDARSPSSSREGTLTPKPKAFSE